MARVRLHLIACLLLLLTATGCVSLSDPEASQVHDQDVVAVLDGSGNTSLSQGFLSRRSGLDSLTIYLSALPGQADQPGLLSVSLYHSPRETVPFHQVVLSTSQVSSKTPVTISFQALDDPPQTEYILVLQASKKTMQVYGRAEDIYSEGEFFIDRELRPADIAFRTSYRYNRTEFWQDYRALARYSLLAVPLALLLSLPGWVLLTISGLRHRFDPAQRFALSIGLSLALVPLLLMWTTLLGLTWSPAWVWFGLGFLAAFSLVLELRQPKNSQDSPGSQPASPGHRRTFFWLTCIFLGTLAVRLVMVRDLATPAWVDSVHHALIVRLILEKGAFPFSFEPYLNIQPADYHAGFHSLLAFFTWISRLNIPQAMLIYGQVLNALAVCAVYLLTTTFTRQTRSGLIAAALAGFLTPMPAYYTSWGRYTQLAGLLILPAVLALWKALLASDPPAPWKAAWLPGLTAGGLFLVHYRVALFVALLMLADAISQLRVHKPAFSAWLRQLILVTAPMTQVAILAALPWFWPALTGAILPALSSLPSGVSPWFSGFSWKYLDAGLGKVTLWIAGAGLLVGFLLRQRFAVAVLLWTALLLLIPNLGALGLPGASLVNMTSAEITLFMPITLAGGYFISQEFGLVLKLLPAPWKRWFSLTACFSTLVVLAIGSRSLLTILNPQTLLSRSADLKAIQWIAVNVPKGETIAINSFLWGYGLYAGADGGHWIMPLTGHTTLPPPVLYGISAPARIAEINDLSKKLIEQGKDPSALWQTLHVAGIHYIYLGERGGPISPRALLESLKFQPLYHEQSAWVFRLVD